MKMFFEEYIKEIKNPSADGVKTLEIIKCTLLTMAFFMVYSFLYSIFYSYIHYSVMGMTIEEVISSRIYYQGLIPIIAGGAIQFIYAAIYVYIFIKMFKSIKNKQPIIDKIFLVIVLSQIVLWGVALAIQGTSIWGIFINLLVQSLISIVIIKAFYIDNTDNIDMIKYKIKDIALLGYLFTVVSMVVYIVYDFRTMPIRWHNWFSGNKYDLNISFFQYVELFEIVIIGTFSIVLFSIVVIAWTSRKRQYQRTRYSLYILALLLIVDLIASFAGNGVLGSRIFVIIVFVLAVNHQNKYKMFNGQE